MQRKQSTALVCCVLVGLSACQTSCRKLESILHGLNIVAAVRMGQRRIKFSIAMRPTNKDISLYQVPLTPSGTSTCIGATPDDWASLLAPDLATKLGLSDFHLSRHYSCASTLTESSRKGKWTHWTCRPNVSQAVFYMTEPHRIWPWLLEKTSGRLGINSLSRSKITSQDSTRFIS
jgi:hypothetical protein